MANRWKWPVRLGTLRVTVEEGVPARPLAAMMDFARTGVTETTRPPRPGPAADGEGKVSAGRKVVSTAPPPEHILPLNDASISWTRLDNLTRDHPLGLTLLPGQDSQTTLRFLVNRVGGENRLYRVFATLSPPDPRSVPAGALPHGMVESGALVSVGQIPFRSAVHRMPPTYYGSPYPPAAASYSP